uniref:Uncharacterized protein LOC8259964 isoform X2 n=1 Tax=Rhizophora mucronata TaxID=61149 RepID=A0A2P2KML9_RHIMU
MPILKYRTQPSPSREKKKKTLLHLQGLIKLNAGGITSNYMKNQ